MGSNSRFGHIFRALAWSLGACLALPDISNAVTNITFFAISDTHYGQSSAAGNANRKAIVDNLNALPGVKYPFSMGGGTVAEPRAVIMPGDLIDRPDAGLWSEYAADYGVNGEGRLRFPVYDGLGNHDVWDYAASKRSYLIRQAIIERNARRKGVLNHDASHLHYSWDWDQVHFVHLNLFTGNRIGSQPQWDPHRSLDFLKTDLERNVGSSGRPILIVQHFDLDSAQDYYQDPQKRSMMALLKDYNCIGVLHGHSHARKFYKFRGLDVFDDGSAMAGDILVFRITDGRLSVANRVGTEWGALSLEKSIAMGGPIDPRRDQRSPVAADEFILNVSGVGRCYAANRKALSVEFARMDGTRVRRLAVTAGELTWDRRDDRGVPVLVGMYLFRIATGEGPVSGKVLLR